MSGVESRLPLGVPSVLLGGRGGAIIGWYISCDKGEGGGKSD